jgi:hypothetical protein
MEERIYGTLWGALAFMVIAGLGFRIVEHPPSLSAEAWAAWVQAAGILGAMVVSILTFRGALADNREREKREERRQAQRERARRRAVYDAAVVVAGDLVRCMQAVLELFAADEAANGAGGVSLATISSNADLMGWIKVNFDRFDQFQLDSDKAMFSFQNTGRYFMLFYSALQISKSQNDAQHVVKNMETLKDARRIAGEQLEILKELRDKWRQIESNV